MSHFTIMVIGAEDDAELEDMLAPYDENLEKDPRWVDLYIPADLRDKPAEEQMQLLIDEWGEDPDLLRVRDGKVQELTTRNEDAKWDWWVIGGRWTGYLPLKPGRFGDLGMPGVFGNAAEPGTADRARLGDIDIEAKRRAAAERAHDRFSRWEQVVEQAGEPPVWDYDAYVRNFGSPEAAGEAYRNDPRYKAFRDAFSVFAEVREFAGKTREQYVQEAIAGAMPCYATLTKDEGWLAPGQMGWFGMGTDDDGSRAAYHKRVNELLDSLPDDTIITIVDAHI